MAKVLRAEVKAKDLPRPRGEQTEGSFTEIEVPADYEVVLESVDDYDFTSRGKSKGWIFNFRCEYAEGRSVVFQHYLAHSDGSLWKITEAFDALEGPIEEGTRDFTPDKLVGSMCAAHIDFPRDKATNEPTSNYREIRWLFRLPDDAEITALVPDADPPTPEPEPGLDDQTAEEPTTL